MLDEVKGNVPLYDFAVDVVRRLTDAGYRALFAGGCVRDQLLGKSPKDYDVATSATPDQVNRLFRKTVLVGAAFGVVKVISQNREPEGPHLEVEVATFRSESGYSDGRHPDEVRFTNEVEDVKRRDFTINGLLYDPLEDVVVDHVGGKADLNAGIIRAIGDPHARFEEDHLRLLRAVRFAANLGFEIEAQTLEAIKARASSVKTVSAERIRDELVKMLTGPDPRAAFEWSRSTGLLSHILPEIEAMDGVQQPKKFHPEGDVWVHTMIMLGHLSNAPLTLALAVLLHDVGKPPTYEFARGRIRFNEHDRIGAEMSEEILKRLRFPNETIKQVCDLVRCHMGFKDVPRMRPARLKRFLRMDEMEEHLELHRVDCLASHGKLDNYDFCREQLAVLSEERLSPPPLINGHDLISMGLVPGELFGRILTDVEDQQLEGRLDNREDALTYVRQKYVEKAGIEDEADCGSETRSPQ